MAYQLSSLHGEFDVVSDVSQSHTASPPSPTAVVYDSVRSVTQLAFTFVQYVVGWLFENGSTTVTSQ